MDIELAKFTLQLLEFVVVGACSIYVYIANKNRVTNTRIDQMETGIEAKIDGHGERIAKLEVKVRASPGHADLSGLHEKINKVGADVSTLSGEFHGVRNLLNTIHQHLLDRK